MAQLEDFFKLFTEKQNFIRKRLVKFTSLLGRKESVKFEKCFEGKVDEIKRKIFFDQAIKITSA